MEPIVLANVARVDVITESGTTVAHTVTTGSEATLEAIINEGSKNTLRSKNTILAQNNFEDLVTGYTITLKDVVTKLEVVALADGGSVTTGTLFSYSGPQMGYVVAKTPVTIDVWTEEKDGDGSTITVCRFRLQHAKGKPMSFTFTDGEFFAPEYTFESHPQLGQSPLNIQQFGSLPADNMTAQDLLALNNAA